MQTERDISSCKLVPLPPLPPFVRVFDCVCVSIALFSSEGKAASVGRGTAAAWNGQEQFGVTVHVNIFHSPVQAELSRRLKHGQADG